MVAALLSISTVPAFGADQVMPIGGAPPDQAPACTDITGPGIPPPAMPPSGLPGYHAAWYGQSGVPILCPGHTTVAVVAYMNTGTLGWYLGKPGAGAYLGTWGPDPGQDRPSPLGGVDTEWASANRPAVQPVPYVGPGEVAWFQFAVRAPMTPGAYTLDLRPLIEGTTWMEDQGIYWTVIVKAGDSAARPVTPPAVARTYYPSLGADGTRTIRVNALMYHHVEWLPPNADAVRIDLTVSPKDFEDQLKYLRANGYSSITAVDLWWALAAGAPLPPKPVLLTFDDGYADAHDVVLPLLRAYGMVATFAVTVNLIDLPDHMTPAQVRDLADAGMDVESHATDHINVATIPYDDQVYQFCTSRRILMQWTGRDVRHFIYPSGDHLPVPADALRSCGFLSAYRKDGGSVQSSSAMYALRRARVHGEQGLSALLIALAQ
jgi:peptidoglycan/xylan/chitin deacetylase (PgdA/CDA1 family)